MRILVACEESQAVTIELRKLGHEAFSCDIESCSGGHPEWHILGDVVLILEPKFGFNTANGDIYYGFERWDLIIAFPPCTYLTNAGAKHLYRGGVLNVQRYLKGLDAKELFMRIYNADCPRICIENPLPSRIYELPKYTQRIQPYEHGHPYSKRTLLWLKGLPELQPTDIVDMQQNTRVAGNWFNKGGKDRQKNRSKTFTGIAKAMAKQFTEYCEVAI